MSSLDRTSNRNIPVFISVVALCIPTACYWFYLKQKERKSRPPVPGIPYDAPPPHWLLGHALVINASDSVEALRQMFVVPARGECQISSHWVLNFPTIGTLNAKLASRILQVSNQRTNSRFVKRHFIKMFGKTSILFQHGKSWRAHRDIIHKAFVPKSIKTVVQSIWEMAFRAESAIMNTIDQAEGDKASVELLGLSRKIILDAFGNAAYEYDFGCTADGRLQGTHPIVESLDFLQQDTARRLQSLLSLTAQIYRFPSPLNSKNRHHNKIIRDVTRDMIRKRKSKSASETPPREDLLHTALTGSQRFDNLSDSFLSDWLVTSIFGGYDTQSLALFGTIYCLAKHREWQEACHMEARAFFDSQGTEFDLTTDPFGSLPLIQACFLEAIRYYPPTLMISRILPKPIEIELENRKVVLPTGVRVNIPLYWIHRSESNFFRAEEYLPQRWVQKRNGSWEWRTEDNDMGGDVSMGDSSAVFSFSAGGRNCVGKALAERICTILLATLFRSVDFELADPTSELKLRRSGVSLVPCTDIPIHLSRRQ